MLNPIIRTVLEKDFRPRVEPNWSLPETVKRMARAANSQIAGSKELRAILELIPKGKFNVCPESPVEELIEYAAFRFGKIDKSDPSVLLDFLENFIFEAAVFERKAIAYGAVNIRDISADEQIMLCDPFVPRAVDELWRKWYKQLVIPLATLPAAEREEKLLEQKKLMAEYDYTVFIGNERMTWVQAFPREIKEIYRSLKSLERRLQDKRIRNYLSRLASAYIWPYSKEMEKRWLAVDEAWIRIPNDCRVFPVHGMESGYEHPYGVSPEWRIMVRLDFGENEIEEIRKSAPGVLSRFGADQELMEKKLRLTDIGVFYSAIWSGSNANFRYAGQVVPNRQKVQEKGSKIFIDLDSSTIKTGEYRELLHRFLPPFIADELSPLITPLSMVKHTAGHEVAHPAGRTADTIHLLSDDLRLLEEAKATMGGNLILENCGAERLEIVAVSIARFCRFFSRTTLDNPVYRQYVSECMVACNLMHQAGVIKMGNGCLEVNPEKASGRDWFQKLEEFLQDVLAAYEYANAFKLRQMHAELCDRDAGIAAQIIELVNRK